MSESVVYSGTKLSSVFICVYKSELYVRIIFKIFMVYFAIPTENLRFFWSEPFIFSLDEIISKRKSIKCEFWQKTFIS